MGTTTIIFLAILVALAVFATVLYNRLVTLRNAIGNAFAQIDVQLKRRYDLIPNLLETVRKYLQHERETLEAVTAARSAAQTAAGVARQNPASAGAVSALGTAEGLLGGVLGRLMAVTEAYPELKASANFQSLQGELADVEDKLAAARRALNAASAGYNTARESFPAVLFAGAFGFEPFAFNELAADERATVGAVPKVTF